ncbi:MAG TPA: hypothetical protein VFV39_03550 [Limnobacter sp.]|nr:hypothetical protein [Limnobacter sp.]
MNVSPGNSTLQYPPMHPPSQQAMRHSDIIHAQNMAAYHQRLEEFHADPIRSAVQKIGTSCCIFAPFGLTATVVLGALKVANPIFWPVCAVSSMSFIAGPIAWDHAEKPSPPRHPDEPDPPEERGGG